MMNGQTRCMLPLLIVLIIAALPVSARAHPHVFVDGKEEIVFDAEKRIIAVRQAWQFDKAYSAYASLGLDKNGDGTFSRQELAPLAKVNVDSLKEYKYFTYLTVGGTKVAFKPPTDYFLTSSQGKLTLDFTLPLAKPVKPSGKTVLEVFDPEYFVAFNFPGHDAIALAHAPAGCTGAFHAPHKLDAAIMARLSAIPAEQRNLPPALADAAVGLANLFTVECGK
jgi:ABC-type uncharacterized transport system substrate-binding protein